jgi:hypothetical protein
LAGRPADHGIANPFHVGNFIITQDKACVERGLRDIRQFLWHGSVHNPRNGVHRSPIYLL